MSRRFCFIFIGATFLAMLSPHPNVGHLGYMPIGEILIFYHVPPMGADAMSIAIVLASYAAGWALSAFILYAFCRLTAIPADSATKNGQLTR